MSIMITNLLYLSYIYYVLLFYKLLACIIYFIFTKAYEICIIYYTHYTDQETEVEKEKHLLHVTQLQMNEVRF